MIYIFDLDGTLCDNRHRLHHITGETKDYHAYHKECTDDVALPLVKIAYALWLNTHEIRDFHDTFYAFTGRSDIARDETEQWLAAHGLFHAFRSPFFLRMRKEGDWRKDWAIKEEWLLELLKDTSASQIIAFDDRKQCVDMYRRHNVTCCQVAEGDF